MKLSASKPGEPPNRPDRLHLLSFDVEEYFHVEAAARGGARPEHWDAFPKRLQPCVDRILELLAEHGQTATFFVLGWIARNERGVVERIAAAGHEIASHGMGHRMLGEMNPAQFRADLEESRKLLEDISGRAVLGYLRATFSITHRTAWAFDCLAQAGFSYDSSVFPVRHDRYGVPDAPRWPHLALTPGGARLLEIPPLTLRLLGYNLPVGGGGYLRLFPLHLLRWGLRQAQNAGQAAMVYLHPWELDHEQPVLPMSRLNRWRHRVNLARTERKLHWLLDRIRFGSAQQYVGALQEQGLGTYLYGPGGNASVTGG